MFNYPLYLRMWRVRHRQTQEQAAAYVGVSVATWGRWERLETTPAPARWEQVNGDLMLADVQLMAGMGAPGAPV